MGLLHRWIILLVVFLLTISVPGRGDISEASILVTGAASLVGANLILELSRHGSKHIVAVDNFTAVSSIYTKRLRAELIKKHTAVETIANDACDALFMKTVISQRVFTHIVHLVRPTSTGIDCVMELADIVRINNLQVGQNPPRIFFRLPVSYNHRGNSSDFTHVVGNSQEYSIPPRHVSSTGLELFTVFGPLGNPEFAAKVFMGENISRITSRPHEKFVFVGDAVEGIMQLLVGGKHNGHTIYRVPKEKRISANTFHSVLQCLIHKGIDMNCEAVPSPRSSLSRSVAPVAIENIKKYVKWYIEHYTKLNPCVSECSHSNLCFNCTWKIPAEKSRKFTAKCDVVFYTVSTHSATSHLYYARKSNFGCNIAFIARNSILFQNITTSSPNEDKIIYRNWIVIDVNTNFSDYYRDARKPSRVPKLSPGLFFSTNVQYVVYGDTSIRPLISIKSLVERMVTNPISGEKAVFAAVRHYGLSTKSIFDEVNNVLKYAEVRPYVTLYPEKVKTFKTLCHSYQEIYKDLHFDNVFDGSLLVHEMRSKEAKEFRCNWYRQYQEWTDRDQLSGAFTIGMMNHQFSSSAGGKHAEWISIGIENERNIFLHILPQTEHPMYHPPHPTNIQHTESKTSYMYSKRQFKYTIRAHS